MAFAQMEVIGLARSSDDSPFEYDKIKLKVNFKKEESGWKVIELELLEESQQLYLLAVLFNREDKYYGNFTFNTGNSNGRFNHNNYIFTFSTSKQA